MNNHMCCRDPVSPLLPPCRERKWGKPPPPPSPSPSPRYRHKATCLPGLRFLVHTEMGQPPKELWAMAHVHRRQTAESAERKWARQWPIRP